MKGYLIDFGLEMQGGVNLTFHNAKAGQKVTVKLSEELLPNGMIKVPMRTSNDFVSRATVAGFWVAFFQGLPAMIVRTGGHLDAARRQPDGHAA